MPSLLAALRAFNRKERFLLLQWVLDRQGFPLGEGFRMKLEEACEVDLSGEAVVAMDYHLDWVYAALRWAKDDLVPDQEVRRDDDDRPDPNVPPVPDSFRPRLVTGSQEDVDLLVAVAGPHNSTNVILCEAKAYSPDDFHQLRRKVTRLRAIFGEHAENFPGVKPRLVLLGPKEPSSTSGWPDTKGWPKWMTKPDGTVPFIPLPPPEGRYSVHRQNNTPGWNWWKIKPDTWKD